jgi:5-oxoprolinase (ATP-hydrolysing) subunit A
VRIDLNVDIGEGFPHDEALLEFASSANVCCGAHAGSWELTRKTVDLCRRKGVRVGLHPGFPDREGMGRRPMTRETRESFAESLRVQTDQFFAEFDAAYIKPHGAWYGHLTDVKASDIEVVGTCVRVLCSLTQSYGLPVMILPDSVGAAAVQSVGGRVIREGFADRAYRADGSLVPRSETGAVLEDPRQIRTQVLRLARTVDSICLHGDTPNCLEFAEMIRRTLEDAGFEVGA